MVPAGWAMSYVAAMVRARVVLAVDSGTVGLFTATLSFLGTIVVALLNGRGGRRQQHDPALIEALTDTQLQLEETKRERDHYKALYDEEKAGRVRDLRALADARGLTDKPTAPKRRRRPPH